MTVDFAEQLDLSPELRMASYAFRDEFGHPPEALWRVPGSVTLLSCGSSALTVATPWGAIAAAVPRDDDVIELMRMERPRDRAQLTVAAATAGETGPDWAPRGLSCAVRGACLLVSSELPDGSGVGAEAAVESAVRLCLGDGSSGPADTPAGAPGTPDGAGSGLGGVDLGGLHLGGTDLGGFDLAGAGLRLVVIDTRVREACPPASAESSPLDEAAAAIAGGDMRTLGKLLTAAHDAAECDDVQDMAVTMALRSGALGARAITDGPGRPALALVPVRCLPDVRAAVTDSFTGQELRSPRFLTFTPAGGPQHA